MSLADLATDVHVIADATANAEGIVLDRLDLTDLDALGGALTIYDDLVAAIQIATAVKKALATQISERLGNEKQVIDGKPRKRHADVSRKDWDHDALLRMILDSRLVNEATGEIIDETPVDKLTHVYGLRGYQAKVSAIRARGLDPSEFCTSEFLGWKLSDR